MWRRDRLKKGNFALSNVTEMILILLALVVLILFVYFLRDKIKEAIDAMIQVLGL